MQGYRFLLNGFFLILIFACGSVYGQFYRYRGPDGTMVITDRPIKDSNWTLVKAYESHPPKAYTPSPEFSKKCLIDPEMANSIYEWLYNDNNDSTIFYTKLGIGVTLQIIGQATGSSVLITIGEISFSIALHYLKPWLREQKDKGFLCYQIREFSKTGVLAIRSQ